MTYPNHRAGIRTHISLNLVQTTGLGSHSMVLIWQSHITVPDTDYLGKHNTGDISSEHRPGVRLAWICVMAVLNS